MAVPKKRVSVSRKGKRHAGQTHKLSASAVSTCSNCGDLAKNHHLCPSCGHYNKRQIVDLTASEEASDNSEE